MPARPSSRPVRAFVLKAEDVERLSRLLRDRVGGLGIVACDVAGAEWEFSDAADLCAIANPWSQRLVKVHFSARSQTGDATADVRFREDRDGPVCVEVEGRGEGVEALRRDLAALVRRLTPRYGRLARMDFIGAGFFACVMAVVLARGVLATGAFDPNAMVPPGQEWPYFEAVAVGLIFAIMLLACGLTRFRDALFPAGVIALGQVRKRQRARAWRRRMLIGLFVLLPAVLVVVLLWV